MVSVRTFLMSSSRSKTALIRLGMERGAANSTLVARRLDFGPTRTQEASHGEVIIHAILLSNFAITRKLGAMAQTADSQHA